MRALVTIEVKNFWSMEGQWRVVGMKFYDEFAACFMYMQLVDFNGQN